MISGKNQDTFVGYCNLHTCAVLQRRKSSEILGTPYQLCHYKILAVTLIFKLYSFDIWYPCAGNRVWAHRSACFQNTSRTTTIYANAPRIYHNTVHTVKFIKTILFGCETQSLIAVLTLCAGFHAFSTDTLTSFPPAKEIIYSTLHPKCKMNSWHLSAEQNGGVLIIQPARQWAQGRLCCCIYGQFPGIWLQLGWCIISIRRWSFQMQLEATHSAVDAHWVCLHVDKT